MSRPRKPFRDLSPGYQGRLLRFYGNEYGWDRRKVSDRFNRGTLPDRTHARGHGGRTGGRALPVLVREVGQVRVEHLTSRERKIVSRHWSWVNHYLQTGEDGYFSQADQRVYDSGFFETKRVGEQRYELETSPDFIEDMAMTGEADIGDDLYEDLEG
jgi:hypothetical protein